MPLRFLTGAGPKSANSIECFEFSGSAYQFLGGEEFGIQYGGTSRASDGVVAEGDEFIVEHVAVAEAADLHDHPAAALNVEPRLRAVG
jgi:hypothetical protein